MRVSSADDVDLSAPLEEAPSRNPPAHGAKGGEKPDAKSQYKANKASALAPPVEPKPGTDPAAQNPSNSHAEKHEKEGPKWTDYRKGLRAISHLNHPMKKERYHTSTASGMVHSPTGKPGLTRDVREGWPGRPFAAPAPWA